MITPEQFWQEWCVVSSVVVKSAGQDAMVEAIAQAAAGS